MTSPALVTPQSNNQQYAHQNDHDHEHCHGHQDDDQQQSLCGGHLSCGNPLHFRQHGNALHHIPLAPGGEGQLYWITTNLHCETDPDLVEGEGVVIKHVSITPGGKEIYIMSL